MVFYDLRWVSGPQPLHDEDEQRVERDLQHHDGGAAFVGTAADERRRLIQV